MKELGFIVAGVYLTLGAFGVVLLVAEWWERR